MAPSLRTEDSRSVRRADLNFVPPTILIVCSEVALLVGRTDIALWGHFVTLVGCVFATALAPRNSSALTALAFLPLFRLVNLGMPRLTDVTLYWLVLVYGAFLPSLYVLYRARGRGLSDWDPGRTLRLLVPAAVVGALLAGVRAALFSARPLVSSLSLPQLALLFVVMFVFVGLVEEMLFRGLIQPELTARVGRAGGIGLTALLFGAMYASSRLGSTVLFGVGLGLVVGYVYDRTTSLATACVIRGTMNVFLFGFIPLSGVLTW